MTDNQGGGALGGRDQGGIGALGDVVGRGGGETHTEGVELGASGGVAGVEAAIAEFLLQDVKHLGHVDSGGGGEVDAVFLQGSIGVVATEGVTGEQEVAAEGHAGAFGHASANGVPDIFPPAVVVAGEGVGVVGAQERGTGLVGDEGRVVAAGGIGAICEVVAVAVEVEDAQGSELVEAGQGRGVKAAELLGDAGGGAGKAEHVGPATAYAGGGKGGDR